MIGSMCVQCMASATTAVTAIGAAAGLRAWVGAASPVWLTPPRTKLLTGLLAGAAVLASGISPG